MKVKKAAVIYPRVMFGFSLLITLSCCSRERGKKNKEKTTQGKIKNQFYYFYTVSTTVKLS